LSIVKHIVEAHSGKVTVESELGRGSAFIIHLPVDASARVKPEPKSGESALRRELKVSGGTTG
jgi:hypothetical protein